MACLVHDTHIYMCSSWSSLPLKLQNLLVGTFNSPSLVLGHFGLAEVEETIHLSQSKETSCH